MKKIFSISVAAVAILTLFVACSKDVPTTPGNNPEEVSPTGEAVTIKATLSDVLTRVDFTPTITGGKTTAMALAWAEGDKIRVFDHADRNKYDDFTLAAESVGEKEGVFTGTPVHLAGAVSYDVEVINVIGGAEVTDGIIEGGYDFYDKQTQPADGDPGDLKYFAKAKELTDYTDIQFTEISGVLAVAAKLPEGVAGTIKSVDLIASEVLFPGGKELTITLTEPGDVGDDDILNLFATLDAEGVENFQDVNLIVRFHAPESDHKVYTRFVVLNRPKMSPNNLNTLNINASQSDKHAGKPTDDGSEESPYLIGDIYQMASINDLMVSNDIRYFKLIDDIALGNNWISLNPTPFTKKINLDGNGKTVSNLKASLFDDLNGTVTYLTIDGAEVNGGSAMTGILANTVKTAASSVFQVTIANSKVEANAYTGGLIADIKVGKTTVSNVSIVNTNVNGTLAGGIIGFSEAELDLTRSTFEGNGTASAEPDKGIITATGPYAGGLVGATLNNVVTTIDDCHVFCAKLTSAFHRLAGAVGFLRAGSIIRNSSVGNSDVPVILTATGTAAQRTAGFVGEMGGGEVKDCTAYVTVTGVKSQIGGFIGLMAGGEVTGCKSYGTVSGPGTIGGFFGEVSGATTITGNESNCAVTATSSYVGGFAGRLAGSVSCSDCYHKNGKVCSSIGGNAESFVGGFAGYIGNKAEAFTGTITRCYVNNAIVESVKYNGSSAQSSGTWVGGFAGGIGSSTYANNTGIVEKCGVFKADKAGGTYTGGFAGVSYVKIEKCRVSGRPTITGYGDSLGGFIGYQQGGHVKYCYSNANPRHNDKKGVGGLIGTTKTTTVEECYASGNIVFSGSSQTNQGTSGGIIGRITETPVITSRLIRWNDSNFSNVVGGESSVPSGCYVKTNTDNDFQSVATDLGWSADGTIWSYPADGGIPSLVGV